MPVGIRRGPRRFILGRFALTDDCTIEFEAIPQLDIVSYNEFGSGNLEGLKEPLPPLRRYLAATRDSVPVPQLLLDLDVDASDSDVLPLLRGRDVVRFDEVSGQGSVGDITDVAVSESPARAVVNFCGDGGRQLFENEKCTDEPVAYCDSGIWYHLARNSGDYRSRISYSRVATCNSQAVVFHQYRLAGGQWTNVTYPLDPNYQFVGGGAFGYAYWRHVGNFRLRRRIEIHKSAGDGFFRAWCGF